MFNILFINIYNIILFIIKKKIFTCKYLNNFPLDPAAPYGHLPVSGTDAAIRVGPKAPIRCVLFERQVVHIFPDASFYVGRGVVGLTSGAAVRRRGKDYISMNVPRPLRKPSTFGQEVAEGHTVEHAEKLIS